jgi:hypothetical protein
MSFDYIFHWFRNWIFCVSFMITSVFFKILYNTILVLIHEKSELLVPSQAPWQTTFQSESLSAADSSSTMADSEGTSQFLQAVASVSIQVQSLVLIHNLRPTSHVALRGDVYPVSFGSGPRTSNTFLTDIIKTTCSNTESLFSFLPFNLLTNPHFTAPTSTLYNLGANQKDI